eukprot:6468311-Amphidinium_carterae.4
MHSSTKRRVCVVLEALWVSVRLCELFLGTSHVMLQWSWNVWQRHLSHICEPRLTMCEKQMSCLCQTVKHFLGMCTTGMERPPRPPNVAPVSAFGRSDSAAHPMCEAVQVMDISDFGQRGMSRQ